ncbi:acid protease [Hymenopellis radicata]|nr:acid protease [Hymenopellis radicata]
MSPWPVLLCFILSILHPTLSRPVGHELSKSAVKVKRGGFSLPIVRTKRGTGRVRRGDVNGEVGLGDNSDLLYTVPIGLGDDSTAVHLDTGSSDLWVITDTCRGGTCAAATAARYASSTLNLTGSTVTMSYGDSTTGTSASGPIAFETATLAGISILDQTFAAVTTTTNPTVKYGAAGIFGLGFPSGSKVQEALVVNKFGPIDATDDFVRATEAYGPLLTRIAMTNELEMPMFAIELQRDTIDIGGQDGMLTIGKLPDGIDESALTWVPVRLYAANDGGLRAPSFAPDEVYPFRWEIEIEGVFLNGNKLADSTQAVSGGVDNSIVSALIDTGNSLLRGPSDVVNTMLSTVSSTFNPSDSNSEAIFPCTTPHTLAFQIGGKQFPIDPRDFIGAAASGDATNCVADNLVSTDPPSRGALFRWSLGDPFFKSNLVVFHYGNLTHPSVDPPRVGIMSVVPANATEELQDAVQDAAENGGNFESTIEVAPTSEAAADAETTVSFVPAETTTAVSTAFTTPSSSTAARADGAASSDAAGSSNSDSRTLILNWDILCLLFVIVGLLL